MWLNKLQLYFCWPSENFIALIVQLMTSCWSNSSVLPAQSIRNHSTRKMSPAASKKLMKIENLNGVQPSDAKSQTSTMFANLEGSWEQTADGQQTCLLKISSADPERLKVRVRVGNTLSCTVMKKKGVFSVGKVQSTNLLIPSYMHAKEIKLAKILAGLTGVTSNGKGSAITCKKRSEVTRPRYCTKTAKICTFERYIPF